MEQEYSFKKSVSASSKIYEKINLESKHSNEDHTKLENTSNFSWVDQVLLSPFEDSSLPLLEGLMKNEEPTELKNELLDQKVIEGEGQVSNQILFDSFIDEIPLPLQELEPIQLEEEPYQGQIQIPLKKVEKKKQKKSSNSLANKLKNFLACAKRSIEILEGQNLKLIQSQNVLNFLNSKNPSKIIFENLFQDREAAIILSRLFEKKSIHRQIQLSVMNKSNRRVYLNELDILKKGLATGRLPNL